MYKVLLVDDEERVTQGMARFVPWEETGFSVAGCATSVARALVFVEKEPVDLVITDIQMPVQSGLDLIRLMKPAYPQTKYVILSAYSEFSYAQEALRLGAFDYLTKPINFGQMKTLLLKLREQLDAERRRGEGTDTRELFARTLVMNFANGYPYDVRRAETCLDTSCPIAVLRLGALHPRREEPPAELLRTLGETFAPCRVFCLSAQELMVVAESPGEELALRTEEMLRGFAAQVSVCAGISEVQAGYQGMREAFLQAGRALHYQAARGSAGVMCYGQVSRIFTGSEARQEEALHELVQRFSQAESRSGLPDALAQALRAQEEQPGFTLVRAQQFCTALVIELDAPIQAFALPNYPRQARLNEVMLNIWGSADLPELTAHLRDYLQEILKRLSDTDETAYAGELVDQIKAYIQAHYAEELTLNVLSERFYVSPVYLSRLFKKKTGINFVEYLTHIRMEKAREYLTGTRHKVYHIAEMIGYENPRYFARLFKEETGCTPQEYRARQEQ